MLPNFTWTIHEVEYWFVSIKSDKQPNNTSHILIQLINESKNHRLFTIRQRKSSNKN